MILLKGPKLKKEVMVACSGGIDSMAIVDFLSRKHNVTIVHYHHGNEQSDVEYEFVEKYAKDKGFKFLVGFNKDKEKPKNMSIEDYWRVKRYGFFHSIEGDIISGHHLNDVVETWVWSSMHGEGKIIPYRNKNVIRPFMATEKKDFEYWVDTRNVPFIVDPSNYEDLKRTRNYIRNVMMENVLKINPGINKTICKKVLTQYESCVKLSQEN